MNTLTKIVNSKRVMREFPVWKCVNRTTPYSWFEKCVKFFTLLSLELGFVITNISDMDTIGHNLYVHMDLFYKDGTKYTVTLFRCRYFFGGGVLLKLGQCKIDLLATATPRHDKFIESRTEMGNWFICRIRDSWVS